MRVKVYEDGQIGVMDGADIAINGETPIVELEAEGESMQEVRAKIADEIAHADLKAAKKIDIHGKMYDIIRPNKSER